MRVNEAFLNSETIFLFRGYLNSILSENLSNFVYNSTTFSIYREELDSLTRSIKDIVLFVINDELRKTNNSEINSRVLINDVIINEIIREEYVSSKLQVLALENLIENKLNSIVNGCKSSTNNFIIFENPIPFTEFSLFKDTKIDYNENSEDETNQEDNEKSQYVGICNSTISNSSNEIKESICRVLTRFIERLYMDEKDFNLHFILVSPFSKPPKDLLRDGMIQVCLPIEWDTSKNNMCILIREVFSGINITEDIVELIIASVSNKGNILSNLLELCYDIRNSQIKKAIGRRLLNKDSLKVNEITKINIRDIEESIKNYNSKMFNLIYSSSIDSIVSIKISIDEDFIGLEKIRDSIKKSVASLEKEEFKSSNFYLKGTDDEYYYPITWFLWGVTGSGKSTLVRSIISLSPKVRVIICNVVEIISPLQGITTRNLRKIFKNALNSRPCILIFDDIDTFLVMNSPNSDSEGETRFKIQTELSETILLLLDSIVHNTSIDNSKIDECLKYFEDSDLNVEFDFTVTNLVRRIPGLMVMMTGKQNIRNYPKELISKIQRHSILTLPSIKEITEYYGKSGNNEIIEVLEEIKNELEECGSKAFLNASEYELLIKEKMYERRMKKT
ncbi:AAA superfamily ATpase [Cryptosporidium ryanae]|uniref:AAA superfamily ATpase n=1 Tax=Cryptosporidium ryanae TaxID=515981 RepID=UPI00351A0523|nr:AAA superfamily ATpase [Cryptosporidium ryanae]